MLADRLRKAAELHITGSGGGTLACSGRSSVSRRSLATTLRRSSGTWALPTSMRGARGAQGGVDDDLFDGIGVSCGLFGDGGQVEAGDLEAVEEQAGALGVDLVAGDAEQDLADGALDGGAVLGQGDVEVGLAAATVAGVLDGAAGGVVVVAELLVAQAWAAAAVAVGEDVAALVAFGCLWHGGIPPVY